MSDPVGQGLTHQTWPHVAAHTELNSWLCKVHPHLNIQFSKASNKWVPHTLLYKNTWTHEDSVILSDTQWYTVSVGGSTVRSPLSEVRRQTQWSSLFPLLWVLTFDCFSHVYTHKTSEGEVKNCGLGSNTWGCVDEIQNISNGFLLMSIQLLLFKMSRAGPEGCS